MTDVTVDDVQGRAKAGRLATTDAPAALTVARAIRHPWYRCQALATVAVALRPGDGQDAILSESVAAAFEQIEPNRVVTVATWPLRILVEAGSPRAEALSDRLLSVAATESHGLRRLDAVAAVLACVLDAPELRPRAWADFARAAEASRGWRTERIVAGIAQAIAPHDRETALRLLDTRPANKFERQARARIVGDS